MAQTGSVTQAGGLFSGEPSRKVRRLRRCLTIFTGVISSSGAIGSGRWIRTTDLTGYEPGMLTSALSRNIHNVGVKEFESLTFWV